MNLPTFNSAGFQIPFCGKETQRSLIRNDNANDVILALNSLGRLEIKRTSSVKDRVIYSDVNVVLEIGTGEVESAASQTHPFQIYQTSTWLKYKVRTGLYVGTGNPITVTNTETEINITEGVEHYWIYLDCTATTVAVNHSATTLDWSSSKIPVGWIDTLTDESDDRATIYQLLEDNVFNPCAT